MTYEVPNQDKTLGMQRRSLPQIDVKALLKDPDFLVSNRDMATKDLTPTQKHFNDEKVNGMISDHNDGKMAGKKFDGVIISKDGYIIDGHHRALAAHNTTGEVGCFQIDDNIEEALNKLDGKDYVIKKKLMESKKMKSFKDFVAEEAEKKVTYYIAPSSGPEYGTPVASSRCRIYATDGHVSNSRDDFRANPHRWKEIGHTTPEGKFGSFGGPKSHYDELKDDILAGGSQYHFTGDNFGKGLTEAIKGKDPRQIEINFEPTIADTLTQGTDASINPDREMSEPGKKSDGGKWLDSKDSQHYKHRDATELGVKSPTEVDQALRTDSRSVEVMGRGHEIEHGQLVGARLNLNVLKNTKVPVLTLHKATNKEGYKVGKGFYKGTPLQYHHVVTLKNAHFNVDQTGREQIATGQQSKFPMASVDGEFQKVAAHSFDGVEARFNPMQHHLFVDPEGRAIRSAEEVTLHGHRAYLRGKIEYHTAQTAPKRKGDHPSLAQLMEGRDLRNFEFLKGQPHTTRKGKTGIITGLGPRTVTVTHDDGTTSHHFGKEIDHLITKQKIMESTIPFTEYDIYFG